MVVDTRAPCLRWIAVAVTLALTNGVLVIVQAGLLAHIIHGAFLDGLKQETLLPVFVALFAIVAGHAMLAWGREVAGFNAGVQIRAQVRLELMEHIVDLGPLYASRQGSGTLSSAALEQVEALQGFFAHYLPQLAVVIGMPLAILAVV